MRSSTVSALKRFSRGVYLEAVLVRIVIRLRWFFAIFFFGANFERKKKVESMRTYNGKGYKIYSTHR